MLLTYSAMLQFSQFKKDVYFIWNVSTCSTKNEEKEFTKIRNLLHQS